MRSILAKRLTLGITTAAVALAALTAHAPEARAEGVSPTVKGVIGGAFLGAEVVALPMGIFGCRAGWAYAVFPVLGAVGGAIGGYFMDKAYNEDPQSQAYGSAFLLAGGMALLIPTFVVVLNATRYHPEEVTTDRAPTNTTPADPGKVGGSVITGGDAKPADTGTAPPANGGGTGGTGGTAPAPPPLSLFDIHDGTFRLGLPVPEVRNAYTQREVHDLGVRQVTELRIPVISVTF
ncbi:hypothetical protein BH09MYX1_BH09MYX1_08970 [soil metagenome]